MKNLVLFVEGDGDVAAAPILVKRLCKDLALSTLFHVDPYPFRIGSLSAVTGRKETQLGLKLQAALKRKDVGGVLMLLDGDLKLCGGKPFCAKTVAADVANHARQVGAGTAFSFCCVLACQEYESWLLGGVESLSGKPLPDGRPGVRVGIGPHTADLELAPRDAKKELSKLMAAGYKPSIDQEPLTRLIDQKVLRKRGLRSFLRLENALRQFAEAMRTGKHISSP